MTFRIITGSAAKSDVRSIAAYLRSHSRRGAAAWMNAFEAAVERLASNADSCPFADEYEQFDVEVRQSLFKTSRGQPYRLIFTIRGDEVRILRVRAPGQSDLSESDL